MPLSDTAIRRAKAKPKPYKLFDSGGLFLLVAPNGGKWWRFKYRFNNKEKSLSLGVYPDVSLKKARERRDEERKKLVDKIDPALNRKAIKAAWALCVECGTRNFWTGTSSKKRFSELFFAWKVRRASAATYNYSESNPHVIWYLYVLIR